METNREGKPEFVPISIEELRDGSAISKIEKYINIEKACRYFIDETVNKNSIRVDKGE
jgi:hypothetical protein